MIKDLAEAIYYCTVTEAMEGKEKEWGKQETMYYPVMYYQDRPEYPPYRDEDWMKGRMYYNGRGNSSGGNSSGASSNGGGTRNYTEREMPFGESMRDRREGRSPMSRKMYMESKEMHKGNSSEEKQKKMKELEKYMNELSSDITEMISDASPEEKNMLKAKLTTLSSKIS
jgi:hypothetical protein